MQINSAFLIQNMFPVTKKYVESQYIKNNVAIRLSNKLQTEIIFKANKVLNLYKHGMKNIIFPNIDRILNQFIFLSILPIILGLIPLVIFCFSSNSLKELNGILFGMSIMGMVSVYPDIYNIFKILKVVPKKAIIQNNKNETYYFE